MRERPILFSAPMVLAILAGRKTQTRRLVKPQPSPEATLVDWNVAESAFVPWNWSSGGGSYAGGSRTGEPFSCPYGQPGDRLWVRETWSEQHPCAVPPERFSLPGRAGIPGPPGVNYRVIYRADGPQVPYWHCHEFPYRTADRSRADEIDLKHHPGGHEAGWLPSIFMPRWASRLTLEITQLRVERLQDISEEDAKAEGVEQLPDGRWRNYLNAEDSFESANASFFSLWDFINGDRANVLSNPWTWAVAFARAEAIAHKLVNQPKAEVRS